MWGSGSRPGRGFRGSSVSRNRGDHRAAYSYPPTSSRVGHGPGAQHPGPNPGIRISGACFGPPSTGPDPGRHRPGTDRPYRPGGPRLPGGHPGPSSALVADRRSGGPPHPGEGVVFRRVHGGGRPRPGSPGASGPDLQPGHRDSVRPRYPGRHGCRPPATAFASWII